MKESLKIHGFEWDAGNEEKCRKHGLSIEDIKGLLSSGNYFVGPDPFELEKRLRAVGVAGERGLFVVFTVREREGQRLIRPISARYMHETEVRYYEEEIPGFPKRR